MIFADAVPAVTAEVSEMDADQPESGESESDEAEAEESDDPAGAEGVVVAGKQHQAFLCTLWFQK